MAPAAQRDVYVLVHVRHVLALLTAIFVLTESASHAMVILTPTVRTVDLRSHRDLILVHAKMDMQDLPKIVNVKHVTPIVLPAQMVD